MVRTMDQPVSTVHLDDANGVFAGGWDGRLTHWDEAGEHVWTAQTNDRISALALNDTTVVVASGLHVWPSTGPPVRSAGRRPWKEAPMP